MTFSTKLLWNDNVQQTEVVGWSSILPTLASVVLMLAQRVRSFMSATNPFQLPTWVEINREQRRRERFKKTVIAIVVVTTLLLVGLLIEGCNSERAALSAPAAPVSPAPTVSVNPPPHPNPVPAQNAQNAQKPATDTAHSATIYIVKSGDTLTRIAKTYGTTVRAIESANDLNGDRIVVGLKLKIPEA
jgi:nucleoid-associated protein YgaU